MITRLQKGESLTEVMVSVVVLSIGLLGMAGLQGFSLRNNNSSYMRTQAVFLANDIIDRMLANSSGTYAIAEDAFPEVVVNCNAADADCSSAEMANYDLALWKCTLGYSSDTCTDLGVTGLLPSGNGEVTLNGSLYTIDISWVDDRSGASKEFSVTTAN